MAFFLLRRFISERMFMGHCPWFLCEALTTAGFQNYRKGVESGAVCI